MTNAACATDTARAAREALRSRGLIVESLATSGTSPKSIRLPFRRHRYGAKRVAMVRELSTLLAAGIPLLEAIDSLVLQQTGGFKQSMMVLRDRIASGGSLADAMREQPQVFDPLCGSHGRSRRELRHARHGSRPIGQLQRAIPAA